MKKLLYLAAIFLWLTAPDAAYAQTSVKTFAFEKGHTIDFLYLTNRSKPARTLKEYFEEVGPAAQKLGFRSLGGIRIAGKPTQGNFFPNVIALGVWPGDFEARANALENLLDAAPNLHSLRMDIWSVFNMTNYEIKQDRQLQMTADKSYILTAYWIAEGAENEALEVALQQTISRLGGTSKLTLTDGRSPFQYEHNPDLMVISEWDSEASAAAFTEASKRHNVLGVRHVNQFPIKLP